MDELARFNQARWDALVAAGVEYSRPALDLTPAAARTMIDPHGALGALDLTGLRVLCLASGGGQQTAAFGLLGARATVLDLSPAQLAADGVAAAHTAWTPPGSWATCAPRAASRPPASTWSGRPTRSTSSPTRPASSPAWSTSSAPAAATGSTSPTRSSTAPGPRAGTESTTGSPAPTKTAPSAATPAGTSTTARAPSAASRARASSATAGGPSSTRSSPPACASTPSTRTTAANAYDVVYRHALDCSGGALAFGSTTGNLYVSEDRGESWQTVANNLPPVYSVRFG